VKRDAGSRGSGRGHAAWLVRRKRALWLAIPAAVATAAVALPIGASSGQSGNQYTQSNLISDIPGVARITDPNLVNPWGLSNLPGSPLWVADNGTNKSTLYSGAVGGSIPTIVGLVVKIQGGAPTGTVGNPTSDFVVHTSTGSGPARFIFASESGRITAWAGTGVSGTVAQTVFGPRSTAVYKGLALAQIGDSNFLFATNFHAGTVDVFNAQFKPVTLPAGAFTDSSIPAGFAPFGIQSIGDDLYVSYAKQDADKHDDVAGAGRGFVDKYSTTGVLLQRLIKRGALNSPWGMALAPAGFGGFAGDLLVGNFGDGAINAYDPSTGALLGPLTNTDGNPIVINGLWGLRFGDGTFGSPDTLVFAAGIGDESHGLLGEISPAG